MKIRSRIASRSRVAQEINRPISRHIENVIVDRARRVNRVESKRQRKQDGILRQDAVERHKITEERHVKLDKIGLRFDMRGQLEKLTSVSSLQQHPRNDQCSGDRQKTAVGQDATSNSVLQKNREQDQEGQP